MGRKSIIIALREAIEASGYSITQLGKESGIDPGQISRFLRNERSLTLDSAEKIAEKLKLELKSQKDGK